MKKRTKWIIVAVAVVGVVAIGGATMAGGGDGAVEVRIEAVESRDLTASVTASGQVQPRTKTDLSADITGKITKLEVKEGDWVKTGQFLLQIDPQQYEAAVQRAEASVASARAEQAQSRANLVQAQRSLDRLEGMRKTNAALVSEESMEQARTALEVQTAMSEASEFRARQAEAGLKDAKWQLDRTTIRAPMTGRVTRLNVEVGETAIMGTLNRDAATLLTISDMSVLETKIRVDETDVVRINVGDSSIVQIDAFPDTTFAGRVVEISNSSVRGATNAAAGDQAVDYEVTIQLVNPPKDTRPDLSATAKVVTDSRKKVLSIPIIALTVREDSAIAQPDAAPAPVGGTQSRVQVGKRDVEGVFIVGTDNKVQFRPVKVGIAGERYFEVLSGLQAGERIVGGTYQAIRDLRDGALVKEAAPPAAGPGAPAKSPNS
ncbi:MAG TPA: efflux RND transporter periplasmic adaptor subunit [Gemmatimonadaceae bacterium]|nr:efflux RND transporter periplasmic adaptor subunit [Gemmatimonadaceae bacterium]